MSGERVIERDALDVIGVGFGPSNIALAVCAHELAPDRRCLFFERSPQVEWHSGMLLDGARMQISFLKDLVSLRNPASPFSFLQYQKACGRLEQFVNLNQLRPTRLEYQDYLRWVAGHFADRVRYTTRVRRVVPIAAPGAEARTLFGVEVEDLAGAVTTHVARNVVYAAGGKPRRPTDCPAAVVHSSEFLLRFPGRFTDRTASLVFTVVGAGQSAGEIIAYLLDQYPNAQVHAVISGYALRPTDNSSFVNEQFYAQRAADFHEHAPARRRALLDELRNTNYGVIREDLLEHIYNVAYIDLVKAKQRLFVHSCARLGSVRERAEGLDAIVEDRFGGPSRTLACDGLVLATGYDRGLDPVLFEEVMPYLVEREPGTIEVARNCRVRTVPELTAGLYAQGYAEAELGLGDTLLSLLPFRAKEIVDDICARAPKPARRLAHVPYPPRPFLEHDPDKLYAVVERFRFATLISARGTDDPVVTQLPLTLDRSRGRQGVLFGHMDRSNPHVDVLDGHRVLALFHGPDAFISPQLSGAKLLPTWNSITVRVHGRARVVDARADKQRCLFGLAERSEHGCLRADDPRIDELIDLIVGFEIEIEELVGRFKLSQDKTEQERHAAALALAEKTEAGERELIAYLVGLPLTVEPSIDVVKHPVKFDNQLQRI